jgi:hypothetical protein
MSTTTLRAERRHETWTVTDEAGGVWWPDADAEREIDAAADPAARAVEIADGAPMRGRWAS